MPTTDEFVKIGAAFTAGGGLIGVVIALLKAPVQTASVAIETGERALVIQTGVMTTLERRLTEMDRRHDEAMKRVDAVEQKNDDLERELADVKRERDAFSHQVDDLKAHVKALDRRREGRTEGPNGERRRQSDGT